MKVFALGTCRVDLPLQATARARGLTYLNRRLWWRRFPIYFNDIGEAVQFVHIARGERTMPATIRPLAYRAGLRWPGRMAGVVSEADCVVVEISTDKRYQAGDWLLNINEIHRELIDPRSDAARQWWRTVNRGQRPDAALVGRVEADIRASWRRRWRFGDGHRLVLRELAFRRLTVSDIAAGIAELRGLLGRPLLIVPHVAVRLADGHALEKRRTCIDKVLEAALLAGVAALDPRAFVGRDGQAMALEDDGGDFNHYAASYLPIVGREISQALRAIPMPRD